MEAAECRVNEKHITKVSVCLTAYCSSVRRFQSGWQTAHERTV